MTGAEESRADASQGDASQGDASPADGATADPEVAREAAKFGAMAAQWWDPSGPAAPLHAMQPARLDYVRRQILASCGGDPRARRPFAGLRIADLGCGGGLMSEPMARLGASVTGFDPAPEAVAVARDHAAAAGLEIAYRAGSAAEAAMGVALGTEAPFDVALAMEVVEHVPDRAAFLAAAAGALAPGGVLVASTLNRTAQSYGVAIIGAERLLRWLPAGTHEWRKFPTPDELAAELAAAGLEVVDRAGLSFNPLARSWRISDDLSINYVMAAEKPLAA